MPKFLITKVKDGYRAKRYREYDNRGLFIIEANSKYQAEIICENLHKVDLKKEIEKTGSTVSESTVKTSTEVKDGKSGNI